MKYLIILLLSFSAFAQVQVCIKAERNSEPVCITKDDRASFDKWYFKNANKGDFGTNEHTIDFKEGEPDAGFESCEDIVIEDPIIGSYTRKRCTYPPKWHIVDCNGAQVDPRNFNPDNLCHLQDISSDVAAEKAKKIKDVQDLEALKILIKNKAAKLEDVLNYIELRDGI